MNVRQVKAGDTVTKQEMDDLYNEGTQVRQKIKVSRGYNFKKGDKVWFDKSSKTSRNKFKNDYEDIVTVVKNIEDADYVIVSDSFPIWPHHMGSLFNQWVPGKGYTHHQEVTLEKDNWYITSINNSYQRLAVAKSGKQFVSDVCVTTKSPLNREMTEEEKNRVSSLLSSGDREMVKLGWTILSGFDLSANFDTYALCLAKARKYFLPQTRVYRTMKRQLQKVYPNLSI